MKTLTILLFAAALQAQTLPELPRVFLDTHYVAATGRTVAVSAGSDLQAALNAAAPGDELVLQAGASWVGNFTLPAKACTPMVTIRTSALSSFPEGTRVTPSQVASMASIISPSVAPAINAAPGACGYQIAGIEATVQLAATSSYGIIVLGDGSETADKLPANIFIVRSWIHGLPNFSVKRGVQMNGKSLALVDSTVTEIHSQGVDSQAVAGWAGPGPYKIVNNELQAGSEIIAFGGAKPSITGVIPSDIEIRRNHISRPITWLGQGWLIKNLFELKNGQRVLFDSNIAEYNWYEGQNGYAILMQAITQDSGAWAIVSDVTITNNIIRHSANGINLCGICYDISGVPGAKTRRLNISNNLFDDIGNPDYDGGTYPYGVAIQLISQNADVVLDHNTFVNWNAYDAIQMGGTPNTGVSITNNIMSYGKYGIFGDSCGGTACALSTYAPDAKVAGNSFVVADPDIGAPGNKFPPDWPSLQFVAFSSGNGGTYQLSAASSYKGSSLDEKDPGVDWTALMNAQSGSVPVPIPTPTPAPSLFTLLINAGGPGTGDYVASTGCPTAKTYGPADMPALGSLSGVFQTMLWNPSFTCQYTVPNGLYVLTLDFVDRNSTRKGQRVFTVKVNGMTTDPIDVFAAVGVLKPYAMRVPALVTNGTLTLLFKTTVSSNNAVVSGIEIRQVQ